MPRLAAAVPRNVFVDGGAWGKFDMAYDDTTTVSDIVLKVSRLIGALYFFRASVMFSPRMACT